MSENRSFSVEILWIAKSGKMIRLRVNGEKMSVSRLQVGLLFLFTLAPEITREECYAYLSKIWGEELPYPLTSRYTTDMARRVRVMKERGLIIETGRKFYQTMKGRAVFLAIEQRLKAHVELQDFAALMRIMRGNPDDKTKKPD